MSRKDGSKKMSRGPWLHSSGTCFHQNRESMSSGHVIFYLTLSLSTTTHVRTENFSTICGKCCYGVLDDIYGKCHVLPNTVYAPNCNTSLATPHNSPLK